MTAKKPNATHKKLIEAFENGEKLASKLKDKQPFDFPCINVYCIESPKKNPQSGLAFKTDKGYHLYCFTCGQEHDVNKDELKKLRAKFVSAVITPISVAKTRPKYKTTKEWEDEYLDDETSTTNGTNR